MSKKLPVHIISGFLGVGKTTTILNLLNQRQQSENIAVIINEYGEVSIDGPTLASVNKDLIIKEVPGGCICCASFDSLTESLESIIETVLPTRIIIEPSGLARPSDLVYLLKTNTLNEKVDIKPLISIIDPELYLDEDFRDSLIFDDQIESADIIAISKVDLSEPATVAAVEMDFEQLQPSKLAVFKVANGNLNAEVLDIDYPVFYPIKPGSHHLHSHEKQKGEGRIWKTGTFNHEKLKQIFSDLNQHQKRSTILRLKGIFLTEKGPKKFELAGKRWFESESEYRIENRCEIILAAHHPEFMSDIYNQIESAWVDR